MNILNAGYSAELTLAANDVVTINPGASVVVEAVSGLGLSAGVIGTYTDGRTLGPYLAGVVKLTAVMGDCSYGVSTGVSAVTSTVNPLTGRIDYSAGGVAHLTPTSLDGKSAIKQTVGKLGTAIFEPGLGVTPTASVGAGATLGSSGFVTDANGDQVFRVG